MARMARVVVPNYPHHITQRGARRQKVFFTAADYQSYTNFLAQYKSKFGLDIWAYCLMPNHVHLIMVPRDEVGLARCLSQTHRIYALQINKRNKWKGHLWQERFYSFVMDEPHLLLAVKYVELNPVRANLCELPNEWPWSSAHAHVKGKDDCLVSVKPMLERVHNWREYMNKHENQIDYDLIRKHSKTGRPAGRREFLCKLEKITGRKLQKARPGPRRKKELS